MYVIVFELFAPPLGRGAEGPRGSNKINFINFLTSLSHNLALRCSRCSI